MPVSIGVAGYLRDHVFRDRAVYPAVEAMRVLAGSALARVPGMEVRFIENADFARFLEIPPEASSIEAYSEIETSGGAVSAKLITIKKSGTTSITRAMEHVSLTFPGEVPAMPPPPLDDTLGLEGICAAPDPVMIYDELVPFGPAYRNIERLHVSEQGAVALVNGGTDAAPDGPLGSPFPLDASFHAACVWGQRYAGIVGFPVHIDGRVIRKKTAPGETYASRITPVSAAGGLLVFNIMIYDMDGGLCEKTHGLHMKDVSGGPSSLEWIRAAGRSPRADTGPLPRFCVVELDSLTAPARNPLRPSARFGSCGRSAPGPSWARAWRLKSLRAGSRARAPASRRAS